MGVDFIVTSPYSRIINNTATKKEITMSVEFETKTNELANLFVERDFDSAIELCEELKEWIQESSQEAKKITVHHTQEKVTWLEVDHRPNYKIRNIFKGKTQDIGATFQWINEEWIVKNSKGKAPITNINLLKDLLEKEDYQVMTAIETTETQEEKKETQPKPSDNDQELAEIMKQLALLTKAVDTLCG